jgi:hypothetical protein
MKKFHEIELISSYLDGQLNTSESARLETRLTADPELASVLHDLRSARGILRKLPARKAPRNFTLTRKMVGLKPPLPKAYPFFRFSTAFATILLMLSFVTNSLAPQIGPTASSPAPFYGFGGGGPGMGGGCEGPCGGGGYAGAEEAPAEAPLAEMDPQAPEEDLAREGEEPSMDTMQALKEAEVESALQDQPQVRSEAFIPVAWQIALLVIIALSSLLMWLMQKSASRKWR